MRAAIGALAAAVLAVAMLPEATALSGTSVKVGGKSWGTPDWSYAGFATGDFEPRSPMRTFDVVDSYGAKRDGFADDSGAIQQAIDDAQAAGGGTVFLKAGRYLISNRLMITQSNVVLQGDGNTRTILYIPDPLDNIPGAKKPLINNAGESRYAWADGFVRIAGKTVSSSTATLLATVTREAKRGSRTLQVDNADDILIGQWVRIYQSDPAKGYRGGSLAATLYGGRISSTRCGRKCLGALAGRKDLFRWAVKVAAKNGNVLTLERPVPLDIRMEWGAAVYDMPESSIPRDCGIQDLKIVFRLVTASQHLEERGFNAVTLDSTLNSWIKNVVVMNADNAFLVRNSHHVTLDGIAMTTNGGRARRGSSITGHIGVGLYNSADIEVKNFDVRTTYLHDLTVRGTLMCVFHNGQGVDLNLDSHRSAPFATLYSNIYTGKGTRVFTSGGDGGNGLPAAAYTTFWNIRKARGKPIEVPSRTAFGKCTYGTMLTFMGRFRGDRCSSYRMEYSRNPSPEDLYVRQKQARSAAKRSIPQKSI